MSVLVFVENIEGVFKKSAHEVVSYAKAIANTINQPLVALSIGDVKDENLKGLSKYGANRILTANSDKLKSFVNQAYASIIEAAARQENSSIVVLSNSFSGKGLAPRLAAKLVAGLANGVVELPTIEGSILRVKKTAFSGKAFAVTELNSAVKVIALNANAFELRESPVDAEIVAFENQPSPDDFATVVKEIIRATDKVSLPEAEIVVSGGRGLKGPENWGIIEELAEALGAATACSKPVSDAGWRPHAEHVGQTGIAVSPNLYIAIGISGAIQHLAGISSSKTIVVINKDPEAPFFKVADYGIVGDAFEIVPKITAAVRSYKNG
ncbi:MULTISPECIES: electron transfer flavoprotein subunit alpha/FixB family protein [Olivibacter]|jgi:electron transfer flavoprotein alpha subunit|uniref:Electron transfer flavoprotein subunit alpha/FixB family protein n=2 Tax=Olivibacter TaxID=376469 RepID=A0ABV6HJ23_9SPHI|nr:MULTISPECIES: electron transfer flavoprotein subunit alpha/FixB family protein [Olivibacter]MCL4641973.1 electron transfer flavoprotein subunit alpha/FixB family protein [Olivibacter sp. UJ_SKK_5.1]MDM8174924.1 electron transfer flavoprotein subunit alpha/FixB family protein [Olivibacter sp. 47]MDX3913397.1 electron transfer flavoprotein subunit alpha/FixB family protein [Pseudosphingobacterium sp.]QEL01707.1 electron transfer flavoprotein subunit alpha/FixB family protein [Olivibacter sp. L